MRVAIVGGAGFIGCAVAGALAQRGWQPMLLDSATRLARVVDFQPEVPRREFDFSADAHAASAIDGADAVIHLGCTTDPARSMSSLAFDSDSNIGPSLRLFEAAVRGGARRVIFASSGGTVYGAPLQLPVREDAPTNPLSAYGVSKLSIEKYLALFASLRGVSLRIANPYGPLQLRGAAVGVIARYVQAVKRGQALEVWGDGKTIRDYIAIEDVAEAFACALVEDALPAGAYNIGSGNGTSLDGVISTIFGISGHHVPVQYLPARSFDVPEIVLDSSLFSRLASWSPRVPLHEGVARLWTFADGR